MLSKLSLTFALAAAMAITVTTFFTPSAFCLGGPPQERAAKGGERPVASYAVNLRATNPALAPRAVTDLRATRGPEPGTVKLVWTPSDRSAMYWIQYSSNPVWQGADLRMDGDLKVVFSTVGAKSGELNSRAPHYFILRELPSRQSLWFTVRSLSESSLLSNFSNVVRVTVP